jgi:hypothetical protein
MVEHSACVFREAVAKSPLEKAIKEPAAVLVS